MIRHAQMKDISRIAEIIIFGKRVAYRSIFKDDIGSFHDLQVLDVIKQYQATPRLLENILLYDDGIVKGVLNHIDRGNEVELCEFYVEPFFKGNGVGHKLIQSFIAKASRENKKRISLWVIKENLSARRFYERNGFCATGEEMLIAGTDVWDMRYEMNLNCH